MTEGFTNSEVAVMEIDFIRIIDLTDQIIEFVGDGLKDGRKLAE